MKILVAGDFCPQHRVADTFGQDDYHDVLGGIKEMVLDADYSIVNFECPVTLGSEKPISKIGPNLKCSKKGLYAVKWVGFKCVTLANNHIRDFGELGVKNTIDVCREFGLDTVGAGINAEKASKILYKDIAGKRLAIINCCEHEFSIVTDTTAGANPLNTIKQYYAIREARNNADYVLVIVHGGYEHHQLPSPRMQDTYRFFVDVGADAVINHHQHCYSGYEQYKERPIFYGLGNFCFDGNRCKKELWHEGYMVMLTFEESVDFKIIPYRQCGESPTIEILRDNVYSDRIEELNKIISDPIKLKQETDSYYASCAGGYSNIFEPFNNRYYLGAKARGWLPSFISKKRKLMAANYILCESHRDKLAYWLNNNDI